MKPRREALMRVVVTVEGGVACVHAADPGVSVVVYDLDNKRAGDDVRLPAGWADLAKGLDVEPTANNQGD